MICVSKFAFNKLNIFFIIKQIWFVEKLTNDRRQRGITHRAEWFVDITLYTFFPRVYVYEYVIVYMILGIHYCESGDIYSYCGQRHLALREHWASFPIVQTYIIAHKI